MKIHIDFDTYFVSVERIYNQNLNNIPCAIFTGYDENFFNNKINFNECDIAFMNNLESKQSQQKIDYRHLTIIALSNEAKKFGIKVGDKANNALIKCPELKLIQSNINLYKNTSKKVKIFLQSKIPILEQFSIDEFFGDLDGFKKDNEVLEYAQYLQNELITKFKLPASIGISKSKWSAKLLTDLAKPFGIYYETDINKVINGLDISYFPGIGKKMQNHLRIYGINTLDKVISNPNILNKYGKYGQKLLLRIQGIDNEEVLEKRNIKSHGISKNFKPIDDIQELTRRVKILSRYLCIWISKKQLHPKKLILEIKFENKTINHSEYLSQPFYEKNLIATALKSFQILIKKINFKVHYIGLNVYNLEENYSESLFNPKEKEYKLNKTINNLREKFGIECIKYIE
ncbi:hypothetical protein [Campylobacter sp. MG1]|uniref:Y-family DNA polymerase n=1 Tax=Campylobacter sp. MG1 TaxID=2976332 RepID=UPI00226CD172|nr:hypothetical protein [Campylobacter sp. MG1]